MRVWWKFVLAAALVAPFASTASPARAETDEFIGAHRPDFIEIETDTADAAIATKAAAVSTLSLASSAGVVAMPAQVTLTATVAGTALKGNVTFKSGTVVLGAGAITKTVASITVTLSAAIHSLTAVYAATGGDIISPPIRVVVDNALSCG